MRLARVLAAGGDTDSALGILAVEPAASTPAYQEARGDVHLQMGNREQAREEFSKASATTVLAGGQVSPALQLKLDMLTPQPARELVLGESADED